MIRLCHHFLIFPRLFHLSIVVVLLNYTDCYRSSGSVEEYSFSETSIIHNRYISFMNTIFRDFSFYKSKDSEFFYDVHASYFRQFPYILNEDGLDWEALSLSSLGLVKLFKNINPLFSSKRKMETICIFLYRRSKSGKDSDVNAIA